MPGWFSAYYPSDYNLPNYWGESTLEGGDGGLDPGISVGALKLTGDGEGDYGPFIDVFTIRRITDGSWSGPPAVTPHVRIGKLSGVLGGVVGEWGMAAGDDLSDETPGTRSIVASTTGIRLKNADLLMYKGVNQTVAITADGTLKLGTNVGSDSTTTFTHNPATGNLRVGPQVSGKPNLFWNNAAGSLSLRQNTTDVITLKADGTSNFAGPISLGPNGGIWQGVGPGTPTFENPRNGLKIWNDNGVGRLATYKDGAIQVTLDSDGQLAAGSGIIVLNKDGMVFEDKGNAARPITLTKNGVSQGYFNYYHSPADTPRMNIMLAGQGSSAGLSVSQFFSNNTNQSSLFARRGVAPNGRDITFVLDTFYPYAGLHDADLAITNNGLSVGVEDPPALGRGVILADIGGEHNSPHIVLKDSGKIAHGMTDIAATETYANFAKRYNNDGGLLVRGLTSSVVGMHLAGYGTTADTATSTAAYAPITLTSLKKSGTGATSYGSNDNIFVVRNNLDTRFIIKGNGNYHYDGTGAAYDDHDDVGLLRTLSREMWANTIDSVWDKFITANRQSLIDAGIISDGGFINGAALNRLLTGAIWQLNERLTALEGRAS